MAIRNGRLVVGPQQRRGVSIITLEEAKRVDRFVMRVGARKAAAKRLGVGEGTIAAASFQGSSLLAATKAKLFDALEREECAA
jgi:hypothetical protein